MVIPGRSRQLILLPAIVLALAAALPPSAQPAGAQHGAGADTAAAAAPGSGTGTRSLKVVPKPVIVSGDQQVTSDDSFPQPLVAGGYDPTGPEITFECTAPSGGECYLGGGDSSIIDVPVTGSGPDGGQVSTTLATNRTPGEYTVSVGADGVPSLQFTETVGEGAAIITSGNNQSQPFRLDGATFTQLGTAGYQPGSSVRFTCTPPDGASCNLAPTDQPASAEWSVTADESGAATLATMTATYVGTYSVTASSPDSSDLPFTEVVTPAPVIVSGDNQAALPNQQSEPLENWYARFGPVRVAGYAPGAAVTFMCSLSSPASQYFFCAVDPQGREVVTLTADSSGTVTLQGAYTGGIYSADECQVGSYFSSQVTATSPGTDSVTFVEKTLLGLPGGCSTTASGPAGSSLQPATIVSGDDQQQPLSSDTNGETFDTLTAGGYADGSAVTFACTPPSGGTCVLAGQGATVQVAADSSGEATVDGMQTGGAVGTYTVSATADGYNSLTFEETVVAAGPPANSSLIQPTNPFMPPGLATLMPLEFGGSVAAA